MLKECNPQFAPPLHRFKNRSGKLKTVWISLGRVVSAFSPPSYASSLHESKPCAPPSSGK